MKPTHSPLRTAVQLTIALLLASACEAAPIPAGSSSGASRSPVGSAHSGKGSPDADLDRYVANDGSDANGGSAADPWATLQHAADAAEAGVTVHVADGVYAGFTIHRSGTGNAPIVFAAAAAAEPLIEDPGRDFLIHVDGATDIILSGLHVRGATEQDGAGIFIGPDSARITVRHTHVADNRSFGVLIEDSQDVLVQGSDISGSASGIRTRGDVAGTLVMANDIHDNDQMVVNDPEPNNDTGGQGVAISLSSGPITIRANRIWGNRAESIDYGRDGSAFEIFGASDVLITENVVWDNETIMETGTNRTSDCVNIKFTRNIAFGDTSWGESKGILLRCARDSLVAHNTLVGIEEWGLQFRNRPETGFGGSIENLTVVNNLVSADVGILVLDPMPASVTVDFNLFDADVGVLARISGTTVTRLEELRSLIGFQESGRHARLDLVDPVAGDFRLLPSSPAIDAGVRLDGVNDEYAAAAPDIGRHESGQS